MGILTYFVMFLILNQLSIGGIYVGQNMTETQGRYPSLILQSRNSQGIEQYWLTDSLTVMISQKVVIAILITDNKLSVLGIEIGDSRSKVLSKLGSPKIVMRSQDTLSNGKHFDLEAWLYPAQGLRVGFSKPRGRLDSEFSIGSIMLFKPGGPAPRFPP